MNKTTSSIVFIILFFFTKEIVYTFYEECNFIDIVILNMKQLSYYKICVFLLSLLQSIVGIYFISKVDKTYRGLLKIIIYVLTLILSMLLVNSIFYIFHKEMYFEVLLINFSVLTIVNIFLQIFVFKNKK